MPNTAPTASAPISSFRWAPAAVCRRGYYEKELFPGAQSYGRSRRVRFTPYTLRATAGWAFSPRSYLEALAAAEAVLPDAADLFYQPQYNNRVIDDPCPERRYAAEINYSRTGETLTRGSRLSLACSTASRPARYYDDMAGVFCDMAATRIGRMPAASKPPPTSGSLTVGVCRSPHLRGVTNSSATRG